MNYRALSDSDKLDLLRVLYFDAKKEEEKELIIAETQIVYTRIREGAH